MICESGLLCAMNVMKEYWIPVDKYKFVARAHEECVLPQDLLMIRQCVLEGKVQINTLDKTTIQKARQHVVGASSPCIKKKCGCKKREVWLQQGDRYQVLQWMLL